MKRYLHLNIITIVLLSMLVFIAYGTKESTSSVETSHIESIIKTKAVISNETEINNKSNTSEAELKEQLRRSPESDLRDRPHSPETIQHVKPQFVEADVKVRTSFVSADVKVDSSSNQQNSDVLKEKVDLPDESVLNLIPESAMGIIYCPSLLELNDRVNRLAEDLMPQAGPEQEVLAKILAGLFSAGFESLSELEEIGLDLNQDFAVFMTSLDPLNLSAIVHLTDPVAIKDVIDAEAEGSEPKEYNGVTYWSSAEGSGSFAILENTFVFSQMPEVCENIIDIKKGAKNSIQNNTDYTTFLSNILEAKEQVYALFDLESIIAPFSAMLIEGKQSIVDAMESDPASMASVPMLENMIDKLLMFVEDAKSVGSTIQVNGTDVLFSLDLNFKNDGKVHDLLKDMQPEDLSLIDELPNSGFIAGALQGNTSMLLDLSTLMVKALFNEQTEQLQDFEKIFQPMKEMYESIGDEWTFTINFGNSLIPDYLTIYEVKDEEKVKAYYDEKILVQLQAMVDLMKEHIGDSPQLSIYEDAYMGEPIMHNEVEIKSYVFPNFGSALGELPDEIAMLMPQEWQWSYAFSDGRLYFTLGGAELIKLALDSKSEEGDKLAANLSYQRLIEVLGKDNNLIMGFSPLTAAKSVVNMMGKVDPNAAAEMQMFMGMLMGVPENYSIGISAKVQDGGIGTKFHIAFGDFKQLIQTMMMMSGMGPMQ